VANARLIPAPELVPAVPDEYDDPVAGLIRPASEVDAALASLIGIPFDTTTLGRRGSRLGPSAIRAALAGCLCYDANFDVDLAGAARVADHGDVDVVQTDVEETWNRVSEAVAVLAAEQRPLVVLGGDHGLTFPVLRGLAGSVEGPIGVISVDAHHDVRISQHGETSAGVPFRYALERLSGFVPGRNLVQLGIGGWHNSAGYRRYLHEVGAAVVSARELHRGDVAQHVASALERAAAGTRGIWLSIDIDAVDGAHAPGTGTPAVGGLTGHQLLEIAWAAGRHPKTLGIDVMEVAPAYDVGGLTAHLAASAMLTFIAGRHAATGDPLA
jgi:formimidoylglutamase